MANREKKTSRLKASRSRRKMTLLEHLQDLRHALVRSAIAVALASIIGWIAYDPVLAVLRAPVQQIAEQQGGRFASLNFNTLSGAFELRLQVALSMGLLLASPVWCYQVVRFFAPALKRREKQYVFGFMAAAIPLFLGGATVGLYVMPHVVLVVTSFATSQETAIIDALSYYSFVTKLMLIVGVAFTLPAALVTLNTMGALSAARILRSWRAAVLLITLFTAAATPAADVISMFVLAIPMLALYFSAWFICWLGEKWRRRQASEISELEIISSP